MEPVHRKSSSLFFFPKKRLTHAKVTKGLDLLSSIIFWPVVHLVGGGTITVLSKKRQGLEDSEQPRLTLSTH